MARGKYKQKREHRLQRELIAKEMQETSVLKNLNGHIRELISGFTVEELQKKSDADLLAIKGIGPASVKQIRECLEDASVDGSLENF